MLRLSKKTDYALLALRHLALAGSTGQTVPARELSETYDLPPELLAKVLQRLVRGGLLVSQQGIRGGYELAKPADQITVADVVTVVDGATTKLASGKAAPFVYHGRATYESHRGSGPVSVVFRVQSL